MNGSFKVVSVKEVEGFVNGADRYPNRYNSQRIFTNSVEAKSLLVRGELNGIDTSFFSPSVNVTTVSGYINYQRMDENSWFELIKGETVTASGHKMFDGGSTPNVAISTPSSINVRIKEGDSINISYKPKGNFNGTDTIKSVRISK